MENKLKILIILIVLILIIGIFFYFSKRPPKPSSELPKPKIMKLTSSAFEQGKAIPKKYTCDGEDINPPLKIEGVPEGTKSLALIVDDPDAPRGVFAHWIVWNIDPKISQIEENSKPGIEGINDFGKNSYGGPCPPSGTHHYHFKISALDTLLDLPSTSKKSDLEKAIESHILDWAELIGTYQR
jgi:Raf kinase inhibitor-like YbhB/YbcL family protein